MQLVGGTASMRRTLKYCLLTGAAILFAALLLGPRLIDSDALRLALIDQLTTALGQPVSIQHLDLRLVPRPSLALRSAQTDFSDDPHARLRIGSLTASLSWRALLHGDVTITQLDIESVELDSSLISHLQRLTQGGGTSVTSRRPILHLNKATLNNVTWITADGRRLGPFVAKLVWLDSLRPSRVDIAQLDHRLEARMTPDETGVDFQLEASDWTPPLPHPFTLHQVRALGRYEMHSLNIHQASVDGFEGRMQLSGTLSWTPLWQVQAKLTGQHLDLPTLLAAVGVSPIQGHITGACAMSLEGAELMLSLRQPRLDCRLQHGLPQNTAVLKLQTEKQVAGLEYRLSATDLLLPIGPPLLFNKLESHGTLDRQQLRIQSVMVEGYQGSAEAQGKLSWHKGWQLNFESRTAKVQLAPLLAAFNRHSLDGQLDSHCKGKLSGGSFATLLTQPGLDCGFSLDQGELYNTDLEQAATLLRTSEQKTGSTPFDRLSGELHMAQGSTHFTDLQLKSTALVATGVLSIDPDDRLKGELSVALKNTAGMVSVPLVVSGPASTPSIRPTTSAMAGGAAGTMILGPGLGTAIGVKAGEAFQKFTRWLKPKGTGQHGEAVNE